MGREEKRLLSIRSCPSPLKGGELGFSQVSALWSKNSSCDRASMPENSRFSSSRSPKNSSWSIRASLSKLRAISGSSPPLRVQQRRQSRRAVGPTLAAGLGHSTLYVATEEWSLVEAQRRWDLGRWEPGRGGWHRERARARPSAARAPSTAEMGHVGRCAGRRRR